MPAERAIYPTAVFFFFLYCLTVILDTGYLRKYWMDVYQIFRICRATGAYMNDLNFFPISQGTLM